MKQKKYPVVKVSEAEVLNDSRFARYEQSKYFQEKDRKAAEFLKKHPIPEKLLK